MLQVSSNDEGQDMWKIYLEMKEYVTALSNCHNPFQRDQIYLSQVNMSSISLITEILFQVLNLLAK